MNNYDFYNKYRDKVITYFGFSLTTTQKNCNKTKKSINIVGNIRENTLKIFIKSVSVLSICSSSLVLVISLISQNFYLLLVPLIIDVLLPILICLIILIKNETLLKIVEPKPKNINVYQRELPSKLKPAHVRMLLTDGSVDETSIAATLLDLIDNNYINTYKECNYLNIFRNQKIILTRTSKDQDNLLEYEKFLMYWFFDICGNGKEISNIQLKDALINKSYTSDFFEYFQALVMISFPLNNYYNKNKLYKLMNLFYRITLGISFLLVPFLIGTPLCAWSLGNLLFSCPKYKLNQKGIEEKDSWLDFKKFLIDFSMIQDKNLEMLSIWEEYLTYSTVLGIDSKAKYEIENFFDDKIYSNDITNRGRGGYEEIRLAPPKQTKQTKIDNIKIEKDIHQELEKYERIMNN